MIQATIETARYCILCGQTLEPKNLHGHNYPTCSACGWVYFADPKVASAVFVENDGKVLLVQRIYEPSKGSWALPAGFIDAGEDPARAAERECLEETGLIVEAQELLDMTTGREHRRGADIVLVYRARLVNGTLKASDDASAAAFFSASQLPPLAFKATQKIIQAWLEKRL
jgi:8-oxo-dGTP diphosphatase